MASIKGELLICDRCKASIFLKYKETKEFDGGWTEIEIYESPPEGWGSVCIDRYTTLCPKCREEWEKTKNLFWEIKGGGAGDG